MPESTKPFRVLCLDGGGMRGIYTAMLLHTLCCRFNSNQEKDIGASFDLIVGTSTGGIIATALAHGVTTSEIIQFYSKYGKEIFPNPLPNGDKGFLAFLIWWIKRRNATNKGHEALKQALFDVFGDTTVKEFYERRKIALCIPTVRMENRKAWVFKTPHNPGKTRDDNYRLVDICLATSAAPLLLPLVAINNPDTSSSYDVFTDGGLWMNNPVLAGLIEALHLTNCDQEIEIISVGTASPPTGRAIEKEKSNWGLKPNEWRGGIGIAETAMDAQAFAAEKMAEQLLSHLSRKNIKILRLPHTPPSSEQAKHVGIDKSYKLAIKTMSDMGKSDAEDIHSKSMRSDPGEFKILVDIFSTMESYQE